MVGRTQSVLVVDSRSDERSNCAEHTPDAPPHGGVALGPTPASRTDGQTGARPLTNAWDTALTLKYVLQWIGREERARPSSAVSVYAAGAGALRGLLGTDDGG